MKNPKYKIGDIIYFKEDTKSKQVSEMSCIVPVFILRQGKILEANTDNYSGEWEYYVEYRTCCVTTKDLSPYIIERIEEKKITRKLC